MSATGVVTLSVNDQLSAGLKQATSSVTSFGAAVDSAGGRVRDANGRFISTGSAAGTAAGQINTAGTAAKGASGWFGSLSSSLGGVVAPAAAVAAVVGGMAIGAFANFEQRMSSVKATSGATGAEFVQLGNLAKQMGADTQFSAVEAAMAIDELAKAGLSVPDILGGAAKAAVDLAAAGGLGMAQSAEIASAAKNNFGLAASDMTMVADLAAGAANASATDVAMWGESIKAVGPTARTVGMDIAETTGWIAAMAKQGVIGSEAGNSMKRALLSMAAPSKEASALMQSLGFSAFDATGKIKPVPQLAGDLNTALKDLDPQSQAAALTTMFGSFGLQAGSALLQQNTAGINEINAALAGTSAADVAKTKMDNLRGSLEFFRGSAETLLITLGEGFAPVLRSIVDAGTMLLNALMPIAQMIASIPAPILGAVAGFAALAGGATALGAVAGPLAAILGPMGISITGIAPALMSLAGPVGIAIGLFVALATNAFGIRDAIVGALTPMMPLWAQFQATAGVALSMVVPLLQMAGDVVLSHLAPGLQLLAPLLVIAETALTSLGAGLAMVFSGDILGGIQTVIGGLLQFNVSATMAFDNILLTVASKGLQFAATLVSWVFTSLPGWIASLASLAGALATWVTGSLLPMLISFGAQAATNIVGWITTAIPMLLGGLATLGASIVTGLLTIYPLITITVHGWWLALVSWISTATTQLAANWPMIRDTILNLILGTSLSIQTTVLGWAAAFMGWLPGAAQQLGTGFGTLIGSTVRLIVSAVPQLAVAILTWVGAIADFAIRAIPGVIASLVIFIGRTVAWIVSDGLPKLIAAAVLLATGLVKGFLSALTGQSSGIQAATAQTGTQAGGGLMAGLMTGIRARQPDVDSEAKRAGGQAGRMAAQAASQAAGGVDMKALAGTGHLPVGGGGAGAAAKTPAAGGAAGAGAAQDPAQAAMQAVQGTVSALNGVMDFAEKAFKFRGFPPPEIMDVLFRGLKDIITRAIELSKGMDPLVVELASSVGQMVQGWVSALGGMVDLAEKMARFRPPTSDAKAQLFAMAVWLLGAAEGLTKMFQGGKGLEAALAKAAISSKVAETLKLWAEFFKTLAEATTAMAKARWDIDLSPVMAFVTRLTGFVVSITTALQTQLGPTLRVVLADALDVASTLKPWADLMKSIAELTASIARMRPVDPSPAEGFIVRLAQFALTMLRSLHTQLGPALLLAMDDSKLIAETLKVWLEPLAKMREVTASIARMRPVDPAGAEGFVVSILEMSMRFTALVRSRLGPMLLVGLEDSKAIAETLGAWLAPLEKVGAVSQSIDVVRGLTQRRSDATFGALTGFLFGLTAVLASFVSAARSVLGPMILVALEDSREIAGALNAWLDPIAKVGAVAESIDKVRAQAKHRTDSSFDAVGVFLMGLAVSMSRIVSGALGSLGQATLVALETSSEVAKAFQPWLDMLAKAGAAMDSIDRVTAYAQQRMDTSLGPVFDLLLELGARGNQILVAVQRWPAPSEYLGVSETIAKTFGAWLDMLAKVGASVDSIRKIGRLDGSEIGRTADFLMAIAGQFAAGVIAVAKWPDPAALQGVSVTVAGTFGAWLDMLGKVGSAIASMTGLDQVDPGVIRTAADWLMSIAGTFAPLVIELNRRADPKMIQGVSTAIGQTIGAWVDMLARAAAMVEKLVQIEPVQPGQWDIIAGAVEEAISRAVSLSVDIRAMTDVAREALIAGVTDYMRVAGDAIGLFDKAAGLGAKMATAVLPTPETYGVVAGIIAKTFAEVERLATLMPSLRSQALRLGARVSEFVKASEPTIGLFDKAAGLGAKLRDAIAPAPRDYMLVGDIIASAVVALVVLSGQLMPRMASEQRRFVEGVTLYAKMASEAVGLFDKAAALGVKLRAAVQPTLDQYILIGDAIAAVVREIGYIAGGIIPKAQTEAQAMVAQMDLFNAIAGPAIDLALKSAGIGEALRSAVLVSATRLGYVRDGVRAVVEIAGLLASEWVRAQDKVAQSVDDIKAFSTSALAALSVVKPAIDALLGLANPNLLPASYRALAFVSDGVARIVSMIETISSGYRDAAGALDEARVKGIEAFAGSAQAALSPVKDVVDVLLTLSDSQGRLGGLTAIIRAQIEIGITSLVNLMSGLAKGYGAGEIEARLAMTAAADFSKSVSDIVKPVSDVVKALDDVWKFAFQPSKSNPDLMVRVARDFGTRTMAGIRMGIEGLIRVMAQVQRDLGPDLLAQAKAAADVAAPVASAISAMVEPMTKLLENPFVDSKHRTSSVGANAAQTRIKTLAMNIESGVKLMVETLIRAFSGIAVPDGLENGVNRLLAVVTGLMDTIQQAMQMPKIDFGKISDLVKAANILGGAQMGLAFAGAPAGGGGSGTGSPSWPGTGGAQGAGGPAGAAGGVSDGLAAMVAEAFRLGYLGWVQRGSIPPPGPLISTVVSALEAGVLGWVQRGSVPIDPTVTSIPGGQENSIPGGQENWLKRVINSIPGGQENSIAGGQENAIRRIINSIPGGQENSIPGGQENGIRAGLDGWVQRGRMPDSFPVPYTGGGSGQTGGATGGGAPVFQGPVTLQLSNAVITGGVDAIGPVNFQGTQEVEVKIEGETIQKTARTDSWRSGQAKQNRTGRQA